MELKRWPSFLALSFMFSFRAFALAQELNDKPDVPSLDSQSNIGAIVSDDVKDDDDKLTNGPSPPTISLDELLRDQLFLQRGTPGGGNSYDPSANSLDLPKFMIGVSLTNVPASLRAHIDIKEGQGIMVGTVTGAYRFEGGKNAPYFHSRTVEWKKEPVPRSNFNQDLLYSFGAFMTICRIQRNNAETRIANMKSGNWATETGQSAIVITATDQDDQLVTDLQSLAEDQVAQFIQARFAGHGMERLVEGILQAQGYTTYRSPMGADGGRDILAGFGALGFGSPRLAVEVKTGAVVSRETVDKLLGAVSKFGATEGLFVSWNGYKNNVHTELSQSFFRVRLWDRTDLLSALFEHYDKLSPDLRAELPLKPVWTIASDEVEEE